MSRFSLKERIKRWLFNYEVTGVSVEVNLVGYRQMVAELEDLEEHLGRIVRLMERTIELQNRIKR